MAVAVYENATSSVPVAVAEEVITGASLTAATVIDTSRVFVSDPSDTTTLNDPEVTPSVGVPVTTAPEADSQLESAEKVNVKASFSASVAVAVYENATSSVPEAVAEEVMTGAVLSLNR